MAKSRLQYKTSKLQYYIVLIGHRGAVTRSQALLQNLRDCTHLQQERSIDSWIVNYQIRFYINDIAGILRQNNNLANSMLKFIRQDRFNEGIPAANQKGRVFTPVRAVIRIRAKEQICFFMRTEDMANGVSGREGGTSRTCVALP